MENIYQETLQMLSSLLTIAVREKDEASERLQNLLAEIAKLENLFNSFLLSEDQQGPLYYHPEAVEETYGLQNCNYNHFSGDSPSQQFSFSSPLDFVTNPSGHSSPAISESGSYSSSSNQMVFDVQYTKDFETVVLEKIGGGLFPENGKFVQAVTDAGQLLKSLLITGPVPKWRNPPVQVSSKRPVINHNFGHSITGNWSYGGLELGRRMSNWPFPCKKARFSMMS